ncbi:MAG: Gfo/Idh/MocA family oxidoreductase [Anaerolineales bacterium]|nr:Gfo/Idh/MocA family oxidoreductase [Anaerolineales bacterium]
MKNKPKIGVIGVGMIADVHIECIKKDGRGEVTWISSRTEKTLQTKLQKFSIPNGSLDYRKMLSDPELDGVIIASPPFTHLQIVKDILKSGKHILLEKPMVTLPDELNSLIKIILDFPNQMILECSCRHTRLQPKFKFIKQMIDSCEIGDIYHIHHRSLSRSTYIEYNPAAIWAHQKALGGGGPFMDQGVYDLSFHLGLLNDKPQIESIRSFTRSGLKTYQIPDFHSDIEEHGAAWMTFDTGLTYYYERGIGVPCIVPNITTIHGTRGCLRFGYNSWDPPEVDYFYTSEGEEKHAVLTIPIPEDHDDNQALITHFLDVLIGGKKPIMTVELAAKHLQILFQILETSK